ncbi:hypothetical protein EJ06DRAFT_531799 [Trichodelitschia bisporula]|uniref:Uncharacterized protein n=1 Tax=Trichodelitschia bisporula TaxID=703511 RepID=A0A6G1HRQ7_9PEZI|nr:hypothetical protein EJ06DRAFT_531799 [Trichodelitschia bisporula]
MDSIQTWLSLRQCKFCEAIDFNALNVSSNYEKQATVGSLSEIRRLSPYCSFCCLIASLTGAAFVHSRTWQFASPDDPDELYDCAVFGLFEDAELPLRHEKRVDLHPLTLGLRTGKVLWLHTFSPSAFTLFMVGKGFWVKASADGSEFQTGRIDPEFLRQFSYDSSDDEDVAFLEQKWHRP